MLCYIVQRVVLVLIDPYVSYIWESYTSNVNDVMTCFNFKAITNDSAGSLNTYIKYNKTDELIYGRGLGGVLFL